MIGIWVNSSRIAYTEWETTVYFSQLKTQERKYNKLRQLVATQKIFTINAHLCNKKQSPSHRTKPSRTDLPKLNRCSGGKRSIHGPKHREDNQSKSLKHPCRTVHLRLWAQQKGPHNNEFNSAFVKKKHLREQQIPWKGANIDTFVQHIYTESIIPYIAIIPMRSECDKF